MSSGQCNNARRSTLTIAFTACFLATSAIAQGADGDWDIDISGSHRTLYEYLDNPFRLNRTEDEALVSLRTRVAARATKGNWTFGAEVQDSRAYDADDLRNLNVGAVNAVEPIQYYVQYRQQNAFADGGEFGFQAGRFTWPLGSGRLIGRNGYRNTVFNFMGARAHVESGSGNRLDAFWMMAGQIRPLDPRKLQDNEVKHDRYADDLWLGGLFAESPTLISGVTSRAYAMWLEEDDTPGKRLSQNRSLFTVGAQFLKRPAADQWDFDFEGAVQRGERRATFNPLDTNDLKVRAGFLHAALGYTFAASNLNVAATYDFASGDDDPNDGRSGLFDPYFGPIRGDLGPTGLFTMVHRNNISAPGMRLNYKPHERFDLMFHWQAIWLDSATAAFGRIGVRDITGNSGTFVGHQIQTRVRTPLWEDKLKLELGAVSFQNGEFFKNAPNATGNGNPFFFYAALEFFF